MKNNDILIIHGTDYKNMTIRLLEQAGLADLIGDRKKKDWHEAEPGGGKGPFPGCHYPWRTAGRRDLLSAE